MTYKVTVTLSDERFQEFLEAARAFSDNITVTKEEVRRRPIKFKGDFYSPENLTEAVNESLRRR